MAFTSGTATSHYDLLVRLKNWLVGTAGWTVLDFDDDAGATIDGPGSELSLQGPGVSGNLVYVNIRTVNSTSSPSHNSWEMKGALSNSGAAWGINPGESPSAYLNLWNASIDYWFFANDRRFIVVAKTSTVYSSAYCGFFLPWGTPAQYPVPLYIGGDWNQATTWSTQNTGRRFFTDPGGTPNSSSGAWLRDPNGLWIAGCNTPSNGTDNDRSLTSIIGQYFQVWPWANLESINSSSPFTDWTPTNSGATAGDCGLDLLVPTRQSERWIMPAMILSGSAPPLGTFDGVYNTIGVGLSAETVLSIGSRDFMAVQNIHRNSGNDFFVVENL